MARKKQQIETRTIERRAPPKQFVLRLADYDMLNEWLFSEAPYTWDWEIDQELIIGAHGDYLTLAEMGEWIGIYLLAKEIRNDLLQGKQSNWGELLPSCMFTNHTDEEQLRWP